MIKEIICELCNDEGYTIEDSYDVSGEHVEVKIPCECQLNK